MKELNMSAKKRSFLWVLAWSLSLQSLGLMAQAADSPRRISGIVHFERRQALEPLFVCSEDTCPQADVYWQMVVADVAAPGRKIELTQAFAWGKRRSPVAVEVAGTLIRAGAEVEVKGDIAWLDSSFGLFS